MKFNLLKSFTLTALIVAAAASCKKKEDTTEAIRHLERTWKETAAVLVSNRKSYSNSIETRHETVQSAEKHGRKVNNWWNKIVFWK